jgi:ABC-type sugar transport system ATPase subunit
VISSELPEVMALGSKVAVMKQGKLEVVLAGADINEEKIGSAALSTV